MGYDSIQLSELVNMNDHQSVLKEVRAIVITAFPTFDFGPIDRVFKDILRLFSGEYPGYRECNTQYHDLRHTTDAFLAMARLIHGAHVGGGFDLEKESVTLGLISALLHDSGYIQRINENHGTGAQYTLVHVRRSIEFTDKYFTKKGYSRQDFRACRNAILCTDPSLNLKVVKIPFESKKNELMGKMLGTADLLCQMADRSYLEKLLFLYLEFREGNVPGFDSELELLKKTLPFYHVTKERFADEMDGVNHFMRDHFKHRWHMDRDLYRDSIENHMNYLKSLLENQNGNYRACLRRDGLVNKLIDRERQSLIESSFFNDFLVEYRTPFLSRLNGKERGCFSRG